MILLISDSRNDVLTTRRVLLEHDINQQIVVARTATDALRLLQSEGGQADQRPSLILLDLLSPHLNGFDFLIHVRADLATRHLPIVVLPTITADTPTRELLSGQEHPRNTAVPQPRTREEFLTALQALGVSGQGHGLEKVMPDLARALGTPTFASEARTPRSAGGGAHST